MTCKKLIITTLLSVFVLSSCQNDSDSKSSSNPPASDPNTPAGEPTAPTPAPNPNPGVSLAKGKWGAMGLLMQVQDNNVAFQFACATGIINSLIIPDANGVFKKTGTVSFFNNETGVNESQPAIYEGVVSADRAIIGLRVTYDDPRVEDEDQSQDFVLQKDFEPEGQLCAF